VDRELAKRKRRVPAWWADAKLGIFIHWVPASVPGYAPTDVEIGDLLASDEPAPLSRIPYSEWYENSLRFPNSPVSTFHRDRYGARPYAAFADDFVAGLAGWDPVDWARRFAATGARYVVLVTKHHDGWCLWPSSVTNSHRPGWFSQRDLVGELATAVRAEGLRFGVYYSGGYDWTFEDHPIGSLSSGVVAWPGGDYPDYADAQVRELIERYRPAVLWNDIAWPTDKKRLERLLRHYFDVVPDGVVNDRWMPPFPGASLLQYGPVGRLADRIGRWSTKRNDGLVPPEPPFFQVRTPEFTTFPEIQTTPWECVRGMDQGFGYNRMSTEADHLSRDELLRSFVDIAAKGGNLLLNVGPRGEDAQIPDAQLSRLDWLADWMATSADAVGATRPWVRASDRTPEGVEVRYTARGDRVWALCWWEGRGDRPTSITLPFARHDDVGATGGVRVALPADADESVHAIPLDGMVPLGR
jgi:alpha-L-fucosidase